MTDVLWTWFNDRIWNIYRTEIRKLTRFEQLKNNEQTSYEYL